MKLKRTKSPKRFFLKVELFFEMGVDLFTLIGYHAARSRARIIFSDQALAGI